MGTRGTLDGNKSPVDDLMGLYHNRFRTGRMARVKRGRPTPWLLVA